MCTVSMIGDGWRDQFPERWPNIYPHIPKIDDAVSAAAFEEYKRKNEAEIAKLRKEIEELKELLLATKKFDEKTGQPNCEADDKVALIKKIAEMVGVDMNDVFFGDIKVAKK